MLSVMLKSKGVLLIHAAGNDDNKNVDTADNSPILFTSMVKEKRIM
jgi:hypothetical protein